MRPLHFQACGGQCGKLLQVADRAAALAEKDGVALKALPVTSSSMSMKSFDIRVDHPVAIPLAAGSAIVHHTGVDQIEVAPGPVSSRLPRTVAIWLPLSIAPMLKVSWACGAYSCVRKLALRHSMSRKRLSRQKRARFPPWRAAWRLPPLSAKRSASRQISALATLRLEQK